MVNNDQLSDRASQRLTASRAELVERIQAALPADGDCEPVRGLRLMRISHPPERLHSVQEPSLCIIAQGSKIVFVGDSHFKYDPYNYFLATLQFPRVSSVLAASPDAPYLSFSLVLDPAIVNAVVIEASPLPPKRHTDSRAMGVSPLDADLLDAVVRMVRLLDAPADMPMLMPLIHREIVFRLVTHEQGSRLAHLAGAGSYRSTIAQAVERIHHHFDQPLRMEALAQELGMSASSFYQHFKAATAMSPLQFQKRLRLQEARRLMLAEDLDATTAAYRVGYNDAAHFNREYKSLFGQPPMRDIERLRDSTPVSAPDSAPDSAFPSGGNEPPRYNNPASAQSKACPKIDGRGAIS